MVVENALEYIKSWGGAISVGVATMFAGFIRRHFRHEETLEAHSKRLESLEHHNSEQARMFKEIEKKVDANFSFSIKRMDSHVQDIRRDLRAIMEKK